MAAITFNTARQKEQVRARLEAVRTAVSEMLDAFVSYRLRLAAAEVGHGRPRQVRDASSPSINVR